MLTIRYLALWRPSVGLDSSLPKCGFFQHDKQGPLAALCAVRAGLAHPLHVTANFTTKTAASAGIAGLASLARPLGSLMPT